LLLGKSDFSTDYTLTFQNISRKKALVAVCWQIKQWNVFLPIYFETLGYIDIAFANSY